ncbi:hypothetical protein WJX74_003709 [Apatococcus lobatus]|uniref:EF-hand domain-containing protein n=1 Tax=Apatococcus lobatus TaxID=904363 RepID=A0AAW1SFE3_9CHLO
MGQETSKQLSAVTRGVSSLARTSVSSLTMTQRERHSVWLDNRLARLLKIRAQNKQGRVKTLNQVLLKFGQLNEGFQACHKIFDGIDSQGRGQLSMQDVQEAAAAADLGLDTETIVKFFDSADLEGTHQLDFREFVLVITAIYIFRDAESLPHNVDPVIINTFEIILDAFMYFDPFGEGFIRKDGMMAAMSETGSPSAKQSQGRPRQSTLNATISKRFAELDWGNSGEISFKEFLYGLEGWVLEEYEDEPVDLF